MRTDQTMLRTFLKVTAPAAMLLGLSGCISFGGGKAPATLFTLTPDAAAPAGTTISARAGEAIIVLDPETDRRLAVQRVAVTIDASNVAYLKNATWAERPARLFRSLLAETIRAKGNRLVFEDADAAASGSTRLAGRLLDIGYDARSRAVVVRYDAIRQGEGGAITTRRFESRVENVDARPGAVGPALNRAANEVAKQVADWLA